MTTQLTKLFSFILANVHDPANYGETSRFFLSFFLLICLTNFYWSYLAKISFKFIDDDLHRQLFPANLSLSFIFCSNVCN